MCTMKQNSMETSLHSPNCGSKFPKLEESFVVPVPPKRFMSGCDWWCYGYCWGLAGCQSATALKFATQEWMDGWMVVVFYDKSMYNFLTLCSHCCYDHFYKNGPCSMTLKRPRKENKLGELSPKEICAHCRGRPISLSCYLPLPHLPLPFQLTTKQTIKPFGNQVWLVHSVFLPQNDTGHLTILRRFWTPTQVKTEALGLLIQERCLWDHRMSAI